MVKNSSDFFIHNKIKIIFVMASMALAGVGCNSQEQSTQNQQDAHESNMQSASRKKVIYFILGSTRQGRTSDKIASALKHTADQIPGIITEIIDLLEYDLPFLNDEVAPASRENINDQRIKKWSDKIKAADAYIFVVPEYNSGYPGVLKNGMDSLYKEWNSKPAAFVGYSGGPSGGASAIEQLIKVAVALEMIPASTSITIPKSLSAFDVNGNFIDKNIEKKLTTIINEIIMSIDWSTPPSSNK